LLSLGHGDPSPALADVRFRRAKSSDLVRAYAAGGFADGVCLGRNVRLALRGTGGVLDATDSMESPRKCQAEPREVRVLRPAWRRVSMSSWMSDGTGARIVRDAPETGWANVIASACSAWRGNARDAPRAGRRAP